MPDARWRRRFRAPRASFPWWAERAPDRLAYLSNVSGVMQLYTWDRARDAHAQATEAKLGVWNFDLDPAGRFVYWFDDPDGSEIGRWMRRDFDGGEWEPAAPSLAPSWSQGFIPGDDFLLQGSSSDDGFVVHLVRNGEAREIYRSSEDASVGALSRDQTLFWLSHTEHGDSIHPDLRVYTVDGEPVADASDGRGLGLHATWWSRAPGDQRVIVLHERDDMPRPEIWSPLDGARTPLEIGLPGEIAASWYPDGRALLLVHEHRGRSDLYRYDLGSGALDPIETPPGTITAAAVRDDGELWYRWESAAEPARILCGGRALDIPGHEPAPEGVPYSDAAVGKVHGFLAEPPGDPPFPTIFIIHGGPPANDADSFYPAAQAWVDHGYAVAMVNYRGSTGYGREWRDAIIGAPGLTELEDVAAVRGWLVARGTADPQRIVISGASWGGYLTLLGLGTQRDLWSLGIAGVPVADYLSAFEDEMESLKTFDRTLFGGTPDDVPDRYRERSPLTYVENVRAPVLVLAGENDPRCPIRQIDNYLERLRALGKPHDVYRYDAGHGSLVVEERIRQMEVELAFAARHLGTPPPR